MWRQSRVSNPRPAAASARVQAQALEHERDGARKALALHGLLKMMIGRKLDRLVAQLSPDALSQCVDADFEDGLNRLTTAVKVRLFDAWVVFSWLPCRCMCLLHFAAPHVLHFPAGLHLLGGSCVLWERK